MALSSRDAFPGLAPQASDVASLEEAGIFDADWYAERYRDVALTGLDPLSHFAQFGWALGRWPSSSFDPVDYRRRNPDVAAANIDPLLHYVKYGRHETWRSAKKSPSNSQRAHAVTSPPGPSRQVMIDGVAYAPIDDNGGRIGVGITTRNRQDIAYATLAAWRNLLPKSAVIVVVDDASDEPFKGATFRFEERVGIARAKNKCLELLYSAGVEHFFLSDDDTYPISPDWWKPYVESPEPHLMYIFEWRGGPPRVAADDKHVAWSHPCGPMLYIARDVLEIVGGMDLGYGIWGHEHVDYSNRIHNAGLTTWRYADVSGSGELFYCLDQKGIKRSVSQSERDTHLEMNLQRFTSRTHSRNYEEFRTPRNVVLASWQHGPDRQRGGSWSTLSAADASDSLRRSIRGGDLVLFADDGTGDVSVTDMGMDVYLSRWVHFRRWLRDNPEVAFVWCVDANDVVMQFEPWGEMATGTLYCGWEPSLIDSPWMREKHPSTRMQSFMNKFGREQLLNCGVFGGDRATILELLGEWTDLIEDNVRDVQRGKDTGPLGADMGPFNFIVHTKFKERYIAGTRVTTVFKTFQSNGHSWWRHK